MSSKILITGHDGYIGSIMSHYLISLGYEVTGLATGYFKDCTLIPDLAEIPTISKDIRDITIDDLKDIDAIIHLAALSNDPVGNMNESWTQDINYHASVNLASLAKQSGVERFLFSSSCIMYGMSETGIVNEESPLNPQTEYAKSKVYSERAISEMSGDGFSPTFLRNGTVYGISPRMRFDTVLNNLVAAGVTTGKVVLYSDGQPWRPVVHVIDIARSFAEVLKADISKVHNQSFNNGSNNLNHQIIDLANIVVNTIPGCELEIRAEPSADQRTYQADFSKFANTFPDFTFEWSAVDGAKQLYKTFTEINLTYTDFIDRKFTRIEWLKRLISTGSLDNTLRWTK